MIAKVSTALFLTISLGIFAAHAADQATLPEQPPVADDVEKVSVTIKNLGIELTGSYVTNDDSEQFIFDNLTVKDQEALNKFVAILGAALAKQPSFLKQMQQMTKEQALEHIKQILLRTTQLGGALSLFIARQTLPLVKAVAHHACRGAETLVQQCRRCAGFKDQVKEKAPEAAPAVPQRRVPNYLPGGDHFVGNRFGKVDW